MSAIINTFIYEFDLEQASISVMKNSGLVKPSIIKWLQGLEKHDRVVQTGLLLKNNKELNKILISSINEVVKEFIEKNQLEAHEVLLVRRDAVFVVNKLPKILKFGEYVFRIKNKFNTYIDINKQVKLFYYSITSELTVSGHYKLPETIRNFISTTLDSAYDKTLTVSFFRDFTRDYFNGDLDMDFYRDFETNKFTVNVNGLRFSLDELDDITTIADFLDKDSNFYNFYDRFFNAILNYLY